MLTSDNRAFLVNKTDEVGEVLTNLPSEVFNPASIDASATRWWNTCPERDGLFSKPTSCSLLATSLFGPPQIWPCVTSPLLSHQKGTLQWSTPKFYVDTGKKLIFAGDAAGGFHSSEFVWIADLATGAIQQIPFHAHFNDTGMTGRIAISADASVLAFDIGMSKLACCFVDNYISQGNRILIADLQAGKQISSVAPPDKQTPLGFAVHRRGTKTILLVDWGDGWERKEFSVH